VRTTRLSRATASCRSTATLNFRVAERYAPVGVRHDRVRVVRLRLRKRALRSPVRPGLYTNSASPGPHYTHSSTVTIVRPARRAGREQGRVVGYVSEPGTGCLTGLCACSSARCGGGFAIFSVPCAASAPNTDRSSSFGRRWRAWIAEQWRCLRCGARGCPTADSSCGRGGDEVNAQRKACTENLPSERSGGAVNTSGARGGAQEWQTAGRLSKATCQHNDVAACACGCHLITGTCDHDATPRLSAMMLSSYLILSV
jgi:hypothetical protein